MIGTSAFDSTKIEYSHPDLFKRRSDFQQTSVTLKLSVIDAYMLGIYEMFQDEFNFSPNFEDILYGTIQPNGSWTGSIGKMIALKHDLGWCHSINIQCLIQFQIIFHFSCR